MGVNGNGTGYVAIKKRSAVEGVPTCTAVQGLEWGHGRMGSWGRTLALMKLPLAGRTVASLTRAMAQRTFQWILLSQGVCVA